jgi:release factor glutamine methyltransferase
VRIDPKLEYIGEVYKPSEDTWLLLDLFNNSSVTGDICVDLGCGSGVLGIYALLSKRCRRVVFIDIQEDAVKTTSLNVALNRVDVFSLIIQGDACNSLPIRESSADIVLANPPYLPFQEGAPRDITVNGGVLGYEKTLCFIKASASLLKDNGRFFLVYSTLSKPEIIRSCMESLGFKILAEKTKSLFFESLVAVEGFVIRESQSSSSWG